MRQQNQAATSEMRPRGADVTDRANWIPPGEWVPNASPSTDHPDRLPFIPAFAARPKYLPLSALAAPPMDQPLFPECFAG
eukprot:4115945-Pyramimonas_sp.AAC.1